MSAKATSVSPNCAKVSTAEKAGRLRSDGLCCSSTLEARLLGVAGVFQERSAIPLKIREELDAETPFHLPGIIDKRIADLKRTLVSQLRRNLQQDIAGTAVDRRSSTGVLWKARTFHGMCIVDRHFTGLSLV